MGNFPEHCEELYAMSIDCVNEYVPFNRVKDSWEDLYNLEVLKPNSNPSSLSRSMSILQTEKAIKNCNFSQLSLNKIKKRFRDLNSNLKLKIN
jgi:hypothetical protein